MNPHKLSRLFVLTALLALALAACATLPSTQPAASPTPAEAEPTLAPAEPLPTEGGELPESAQEIAEKARMELAARLGLPVDGIAVLQVESVDWPDGCLGIQAPHMACLAVITPGYRITLDADGQEYEYRANLDGSLLLPADPLLDASTDAIAESARQALATQLDIPLEQIAVVSVEFVEWPNGCLGITYLDQACTEAIVPGYRILLEANGQQYEYRSNLDGSQLVPAFSELAPGSEQVALAARKALATQLQISEDNITILSVEAVEWPDSCLGVSAPGQVCAQVITPGYRILLEANGQQHTYHSNQDGGLLVYVPAAAP